jgi:sorbitol/mannitol transport system substrate-binding protein
VAKFAAAEGKALSTTREQSTCPSPYGRAPPRSPSSRPSAAAGQQMAAALLGKVTVEQALELSQQTAEREMRKGGLQVGRTPIRLSVLDRNASH